MSDTQLYHEIKRTVSNDGEILNNEITQHYMPFKRGRGYNFKYSAAKLKNYLDIPLPKAFTAAETGRIYWLSQKIHAGSNLLKKKEHRTLVPITKADMQETVGLCSSKFSPFWRKVTKYSIIKAVTRGNEKYYCFNPIYFNSTTYIDLDLYLDFQAELKEHLPQWAIDEYTEWAVGKVVNDERGVVNE